MASSRTFYSLYILFCAIGFVIVLEMAGWFLLNEFDQGHNAFESPRHLYHPYRSHQLNPQYKRSIDSHGQLIHSADGFRQDSIVSLNKDPDTIRIIMMGGSTLYGIGSTDPYPKNPSLRNTETISYFLQKMLNSSAEIKQNVEVINAAVSAYKTFHHLTYFNEVLYQYEPDLVLFVDGHNDFYETSITNHTHEYKLGTVRLTSQFDSRSLWFTTLSVVRFFARYSNFFMAVERYMQRNWKFPNEQLFLQPGEQVEQNIDFPDNLQETFNQGVLRNYLQFKALSELYRFNFQIYLQPQVTLEPTDLLSDKDRDIQRLTESLENSLDRSLFLPFFDKVFSENGLDFYDFSSIASEATTEDALYTDYCHLTALGSEIFARRMLPSVITKILDNKY